LDCPFFDCVSSDIVKALALIMKSLTFCAGDIICEAGEFGQSMYFLESGTAQVISEGSTVVATLVNGSFFGETSVSRHFLSQIHGHLEIAAHRSSRTISSLCSSS
jgi:CRP-like cAMP-binding protein